MYLRITCNSCSVLDSLKYSHFSYNFPKSSDWCEISCTSIVRCYRTTAAADTWPLLLVIDPALYVDSRIRNCRWHPSTMVPHIITDVFQNFHAFIIHCITMCYLWDSTTICDDMIVKVLQKPTLNRTLKALEIWWLD